MTWLNRPATEEYLIAVYGNAAYDIARVLIMNTAAGIANMALARIIHWNLDGEYSCAVRAVLHANFLKMGFDCSAKSIAKHNLFCY